MAGSTGTILDGIDHVVVLMLENRSFDNLLGWLYDPANEAPYDKVPDGQTFDGVSGKGLTNPFTGHAAVPFGSTPDTTSPFPDPGEEYENICAQLFGIDPPPAVPFEPQGPPTMAGFVNNYARQEHVTDTTKVMHGLRPDSLPVFSRLAHEFVVCDRWFAPVPSQTLTNRSFMHAGTASGHVNNKVGIAPIFINNTDTIYDRLRERNLEWKIYFGSHWYLCNAFLTQKHLERDMLERTGRFQHFQQLICDAAAGKLPEYAFVEPNFLDSPKYGRENDMHPAAGVVFDGMPADAKFGDELVRKLYQALKNGPKWANTLLIVTFDEHGGCFDHVPPGPAAPPDHIAIPPGQDGYSGFKFDRYGVRVPALLISPRLQAGTVDHTVYDHTSIIRSVLTRFGARLDLGNRVANANPIDPPQVPVRGPADVPDFPTPLVADTSVDDVGTKPLNDLQHAMVQAAMQRLQGLLPPLAIAPPVAELAKDVEDWLARLESKFLAL